MSSNAAMMPDPAARRRGRPRLAATDRAILDATLRHLAERGYARMSIDAIASEARVSKPTIYLRWRNKAELATAAIAYFRETETWAMTGDVRAQLAGLLRRTQFTIGQLLGTSFLGTLLAEEREHPGLIAGYRDSVVRPRRQLVRELLQLAQRRGELRTDLDLDSAVELISGAYYARVIAGEPFDDGWAERVIATIWRGMAADAPATSAGADPARHAASPPAG
jgi:AcrR family transcriptional regulator